MKDYYKRLGVKPDASNEEIKKAFRQLSKKYHPDMHGGSHSYAEDVFKEIKEAYENLSDETKRNWYDYELQLYYNPPKPTYVPPEEPGYQYTSHANSRPYTQEQSPYRTPQVEKVNIFQSLKVWLIFGIGGLWMVLMFIYYINNEGKGGDNYVTGSGSSSNVETQRRYKLLEKYDEVPPFKNGVTWAYKNSQYELIDTNGKVLSKKYDWADAFNDGIAVVKVGNMYGYVNTRGNELTLQQFEFAEAVHGGIAIVQEKRTYYILHLGANRKKIELSGVKAVGTYAEGLLPIQMADSEKWGFIDETGKGIISPSYWEAAEFRDDLAGVKDTTSHLWGFINNQGKLIIPFEYEKVSLFEDGKARVSRNNKTYIIDKTNKCVADCK